MAPRLAPRPFDCLFDLSILPVGTAGFEPATPWPPVKCATKLRYVPELIARLRHGGRTYLSATEPRRRRGRSDPGRPRSSPGRGAPAAGVRASAATVEGCGTGWPS